MDTYQNKCPGRSIKTKHFRTPNISAVETHNLQHSLYIYIWIFSSCAFSDLHNSSREGEAIKQGRHADGPSLVSAACRGPAASCSMSRGREATGGSGRGSSVQFLWGVPRSGRLGPRWGRWLGGRLQAYAVLAPSVEQSEACGLGLWSPGKAKRVGGS